MNFRSKPVTFAEVREPYGRSLPEGNISARLMKYRIRTDRCLADINERVTKKKSGFTSPINHDDEPVQTITAGGYAFRMCDGLLMTDKDIIRCQTFPEDYDFMGQSVQYVCGMSVPPVMMAKISEQVYRQWLKSVQNDG
jgi:DNA (cytosine-5)-methyltransferase 1